MQVLETNGSSDTSPDRWPTKTSISIYDKKSNNVNKFTFSGKYKSDEDRFDDIESPSLDQDELSGGNSTKGKDIGSEPLVLQHFRSHFPYFSIAITIAIWATFILGVVLSKESHYFGASRPVSPPEHWNLWFYTISPFPSCQDMRIQVWRLISLQFVHSGLIHVGFNSLILLPYSMVLEISNGAFRTALIFELGVLTGALTFSYFFPYTGLVGASAGIYALFGACFANFFLNVDSMPQRMAILMALILLLQIGCEVIGYCFMYKANTAYTAHIGGFLAGLFSGISILVISVHGKIKNRIKYAANILGLSLLGYLIYHFITSFPPKISINPQFHPMTKSPCCSELFDIAIQENLPLNNISDRYFCRNDNLQYKFS